MAVTRAVDRSDLDRDVAFSTFATPTILGELRRHFRDRTWAVRPPRGLLELTLRVEHSAAQLAAEQALR